MAENEQRERPKKPWREIDAGRDRSSHQTSTDRERERKPRRGQPSTTQYKAALDRLFESGDIVKVLEQVAPGKPTAPAPPDTRAKLLGRVHAALGADEVTAAVNAYLAKFEQPPEEFEFLGAMLEHRAAGRVEEAMRLLELLLDRGERPRRPRALIAHLRMIEEVSDEAELRRAAGDLRRKLG